MSFPRSVLSLPESSHFKSHGAKMASTSGRSSVSASAMNYLLLAMVRDYHEKGEVGRRQMEEMGAQLGSQLAER